MPGIDKPRYPRPKGVKMVNDEESWINCADTVEIGTPIFDYVGEDEQYGDYEPTPNGEYETESGLILTVEDGVITEVVPAG